MKTRISFLAVSVLLAAAISAVAPASSALALNNVDAYTCMKARDLKVMGSVPFAPNPVAVLAYSVGSGNCTLGGISQVCFPSNVNSDVAGNSAIAQCCFKAKCDNTLAPLPSVNINNDDGGAGSFSMDVAAVKAATICVPCDYIP